VPTTSDEHVLRGAALPTLWPRPAVPSAVRDHPHPHPGPIAELVHAVQRTGGAREAHQPSLEQEMQRP